MGRKRPKLLGIAASLRNARWGIGNRELIDSLKKISNEEDLFGFLTEESELHLENFLEAGRREGKSFQEIYNNLKKSKGNKGLSNSEVGLAAALWSAFKIGVDIDHLSLSGYFTASGEARHIDELKDKLVSADGLLISGPVYFGDRSSLAQELILMIRNDPELCNKLKGKIYGGITVGAKRNGGQETTLIYQLLDMVSLGFLGVGNDSDTTAQYGGTGHAGDVGTMYKDNYGLKTSMGTGRRVAGLIRRLSHTRELNGPIRILFLIMQDSKDLAKRWIKDIISIFDDDKIAPKIIDITNMKIRRCIACDICPTNIDLDEVYRCVIKSKDDDFESLHKDLLNYDAIVPVTVSVSDTTLVKTNYQSFIERSRYLRRGDFVFSDIVVAPLCFEEVGVREYYPIRLLTSMIRHHTIMSTPIVGYIHGGNLLNYSQILSEFSTLVDSARKLTAARLAEANMEESVKYHPVGYVLSANKDVEDERLKKREEIVKYRADHIILEAKTRLKPLGTK